MKKRIKALLFTVFLCPVMVSAVAQINIEKLRDAPGKLTRNRNTLAFIQSFKALSMGKAASLAYISDKIMDIICQQPPLNPPTGFNADVHAVGLDTKLKEKEPRFQVDCMLRYLTKDSRYTGIKESMDGADLYLIMNDYDIFDQMGNYWQDCYKLKFQLFFESPVYSDSSSDYIEFQYKGDPVRIVLGNNKPLLIALTRKEYIQFLIKYEQESIKSDSDAVKTSLEGEQTIRKLMKTETGSDRDYAASSLKSMDEGIEQFRKNMAQSKAEVERCKALLQSMSPEETRAPARVDYNKNTSTRLASLTSLLPAGETEGTLLVKINPDYYDRSPGAPTAQMLVMYYAIPGLDYTKSPDYLGQAMLDIFHHIDYQLLKAAMQ
ncbi:hypothetical protein [Arachidicoccus terrestris]|uniref:hypothetical protein n=1 Tax=Arachidicoccus terrestris TaxID=2875539 RepID=UPI001CC5BE72|nr:hypothetical protein [Arachidicoccus terrestris]UAY55328.1 hypothetical protein K9M52_18290 [Arachidicoccus terrestris]